MNIESGLKHNFSLPETRIYQEAKKLIKRVRQSFEPKLPQPESDPKSEAEKKARAFVLLLSQQSRLQILEKPFSKDDVVDFNQISRDYPVGLRFDINLKPEIRSYSLQPYEFLVLVSVENQYFIFYPLDLSVSVQDDGFIFKASDIDNIKFVDMTNSFGETTAVKEFGQRFRIHLTGKATDIDETTRVELISTGKLKSARTQIEQSAPNGKPIWQM